MKDIEKIGQEDFDAFEVDSKIQSYLTILKAVTHAFDHLYESDWEKFGIKRIPENSRRFMYSFPSLEVDNLMYNKKEDFLKYLNKTLNSHKFKVVDIFYKSFIGKPKDNITYNTQYRVFDNCVVFERNVEEFYEMTDWEKAVYDEMQRLMKENLSGELYKILCDQAFKNISDRIKLMWDIIDK